MSNVSILEQMQVEAIDNVVHQLEYAVHNLNIIKEKVLAGQELSRTEQKFVEGYLK